MNQLIINAIVYIVFPICVFSYSKINFKEQKGELLSLKDSIYLRGVAAFFVVFAHLLSEIVSTGEVSIGIAYPFVWFGGIGVCIFFFLSGYGIWCAYGHKELHFSFLAKRIGRTVPVFIVLRLLTGWVLLHSLNIQGLWQYVLFLIGIVKPMWFVVEILLIYMAFFLICKMTMRYRIIGMIIFLSILSLVCYLGGLEERWYNSNMLFAMGMLVAKHKLFLKEVLQKKRFCFLILFGFMFLCFSMGFVLTKGYLVSVFLKILAGFFVCMLFVVINLFVTWNGRLIRYVGENSLEIYLVHQNVWKILCFWDLQIGYMFVWGIVASILIITIYKYIEKKLIKNCKERK